MTTNDAQPPSDDALGPMMAIMAWRQDDTTSTIDDALRDGLGIARAIAA